MNQVAPKVISDRRMKYLMPAKNRRMKYLMPASTKIVGRNTSCPQKIVGRSTSCPHQPKIVGWSTSCPQKIVGRSNSYPIVGRSNSCTENRRTKYPSPSSVISNGPIKHFKKIFNIKKSILGVQKNPFSFFLHKSLEFIKMNHEMHQNN